MTPGFIYAGHIGDGALPDSTLVRIGRGSGSATVVVVPTALEPSGIDWPDGWLVADDNQIDRYQGLVVSGDDGGDVGTLVRAVSSVGDVRVDVGAIDALIDEILAANP